VVVAVRACSTVRWPLILVYPTFLVPFCTWLLIGYFKSIPYELERNARWVDGATRLQILWRITLPLAVPGLISGGHLQFSRLSWNEFIYCAGPFIQSSANKTVPVAILTETGVGRRLSVGRADGGASLLGSLPVRDLLLAVRRLLRLLAHGGR